MTAPSNGSTRTNPPNVLLGRVRYWPAMDGLRAVAILAVLADHVGVLPGGGFGVDVFFVLSGFLITSILLEESSSPSGISIRRFYERRVLRLLPAVVVSVAVAVLVGQLVLTPHQRSGLGSDVLWIAMYVQNFHEVIGRPTPMLDQYWSLSMEEQFYVLWSLILVGLLLLRLDRRRTAIVLFGLAVVPVVWGSLLLHWGVSSSRLATTLDTRGEGLLAGCGLAFFFVGRPQPSRVVSEKTPAVATICSCLVLLLLFRLSPRNTDRLTAFSVHGAYLVVAAATGWLVYDIVTQRTLITRLLSHRLLVVIGKLSYSLYLVHKIFYTAFLTLHLERWLWIALSVSTSFVAAALLHFGVERPFLGLKRRFSVPVAPRPRQPAPVRVPEAAGGDTG